MAWVTCLGSEPTDYRAHPVGYVSKYRLTVDAIEKWGTAIRGRVGEVDTLSFFRLLL
jgi:hypothetical protein